MNMGVYQWGAVNLPLDRKREFTSRVAYNQRSGFDSNAGGGFEKGYQTKPEAA